MNPITDSQRVMAEALPSMIWTATPDGVVDYVNQIFEDYTGEPTDLAADGGWLGAVHPDDREPTVEVWMKCIQTGAPYKTEFRIIHKASGMYRWHYVAADPHRGTDGEIVRWYGITTDIHDTKLAERAVAQAHRDLKRLLALQTLETRVLDKINAEERLEVILEEITTTVDDLLPEGFCSILIVENDTVRSVLAPRLPQAYGQHIIGLRIGEGVCSCGTAAARKQPVITTDLPNDPLWASFPDLLNLLDMKSCWSIPVLDSHERVVATFGIYFRTARTPSSDDSNLLDRICHFLRVAIERTRMRLAAKASEARFRAIAQASSDVIWEHELETDKMWYSEGMQRLFGHNPLTDPLLQSGSQASTYIHDDDRENAVTHMALATRQGKNWQVEFRYQRANGSYAHVINRAVVMLNDNGQPERVMGSITDITEQKALEEQLRRSQRLEAVGQLTGGIAHDFNNLLTIILGDADQLAEELDAGSEHQELAKTIKSAARRGANLVRSLMTFSRQQVLNPKPVRATDLIAGMQTLLQRAVGTHISLLLNLQGRSWPVLLDAGQFENALLNLAINARDAMPDGGTLTLRTSDITLTTRQIDGEMIAAGDYTLVEVIDTGHGMDTEIMKRAFDPFFTTKEQGKGNGLGLSMVYGFVKQSKGHISIDSNEESGTCVRMYFPRHALDDNGVTHIPAARSSLHKGNERILVVEDEPIVQQFIVTQLKLLGYSTLAADNGPQAVELLTANPDIDLLFTDMTMPSGMDGLAIANIARKMKPSIKVIISSGYSEKLSAASEMTVEGYWVLVKPYARAELAMRLRQALDGVAPRN